MKTFKNLTIFIIMVSMLIFNLGCEGAPSHEADKKIVDVVETPEESTITDPSEPTEPITPTEPIVPITPITPTPTIPPVESNIDVESISIISSLYVELGTSYTFTTSIVPDNATNKFITYTNSDNNVLSINEELGTITTKAIGITTITVTTINGKTATCDVTVYVPAINVTSVDLDSNTNSMYVGQTFTLSETVNPSDASNKNVTWGSSDSDVASVDLNGVVMAKDSGVATITVTTEDGAKIDNCVVTVSYDYKNVSFSSGNSTSGSVPDSVQIVNGNNVTLPNQNTLVYELASVSLSFKGWNTKSDFTGTLYVEGTEVLISEAITFYAEFDTKIIGKERESDWTIFYDKGSYSDGWRFIEVKNTDMLGLSSTVDVNAWMIGYGRDIYIFSEAYAGIGDGKLAMDDALANVNIPENNLSIFNRVRTSSNFGSAEFYLPSKDELSLALKVLYKKGLVELNKNYWTCTESEILKDRAYTIMVYGLGDASYEMKIKNSYYAPVRPIRYF